jgi:hypothetical protein
MSGTSGNVRIGYGSGMAGSATLTSTFWPLRVTEMGRSTAFTLDLLNVVELLARVACREAADGCPVELVAALGEQA